jgi:hypothetical protein
MALRVLSSNRTLRTERERLTSRRITLNIAVSWSLQSAEAKYDFGTRRLGVFFYASSNSIVL